MKSSKQGKKLPNGVVVIKETGVGGMRKLRSPHNGQVAVPTTTSDGKTVFRTPSGHTYITKPM